MNSSEAPVWLPRTVEPAWLFLADYPLVLALCIAVAGVALALTLRWIMLKPGLDIVRKLPGEMADRLLEIAATVLALVIVYLALALAVQVLNLPGPVEQITIRVMVSILILQLTRHALRAAHLAIGVLGSIRDRFPVVEDRTVPLFDMLTTVLVIGVSAYALLQVWNIDPTAWLASAGVLGIAVGFAARDTLANLFAGFFIIADAPYKNGDYILLDTGERGEVTKVGIRSTRILTRDDVEITMPNSIMANSKIVNQSGGNWERFRIRIKIGVAYGSDLDQVVEVLQSIADEHETVCRNPRPRVRMRTFGDSSLNFELLCWVDRPAQRGRVTHELNMRIYKTFEREGISIPFPQRDVWLREPRGDTSAPLES
ncbi:mechanosensitive ion channel family protein [Elongatibacter sediminis]|uniref:Small-conductance mechanosensitive channel n=1 Tax=Elongatibacter sediminis TaxID=3119006 RepID=A0AAW9R6I1_9GAMM